MRSRAFLTLLLSIAITGHLRSQDSTDTEAVNAYRKAAVSVEADLRSALEELAEVRQKIATEKPAIAKESNRIAAELRESRRRADLARTRKDAVETEFAKADSDLKSWRDEKIYLESLLLDFRKSYESAQSLARVELETEILAGNDLESRLALVEKSLEQLQASARVQTLSGEAVSGDGILIPGTFVEAGPVRWFLSEDGGEAGIVAAGSDLRPKVISGTVDDSELKLLIEGKSGNPAFDPTLGTAIALTETKSSLLSHIKQGGFWIYPILFLAAVALVAAIYKWIQLAKLRSFSSTTLQQILSLASHGKAPEALNKLAAIPHPAARVLARGIQTQSNDITPPNRRDDIEESMYETFLGQQPALQRGLPFIAIASATAPLLGLLGTVTGMIETFRLINIFGTGDAKSLASGISEALVTTEFGLIVAIPALILHALLSRKVQGIKSTMEMTSLAFLNGIQSDSLKEGARS